MSFDDLRAMFISLKLFIFALYTKDTRFVAARHIKAALEKDMFSESVNLFTNYMTSSKSVKVFLWRARNIFFYLNYIKSTTSIKSKIYYNATVLLQIVARKFRIYVYSYSAHLTELGELETLEFLKKNANSVYGKINTIFRTTSTSLYEKLKD